MKICAIICEFNPFHNGHAYLLEQAKILTGCDAALCIMSGSFTQRGEMCVLGKYSRARHAVLGGADAVIELPAPFAVAPAEIFAKGAIKIFESIPEVKYLAFGCESGNDVKFSEAAEILNTESREFCDILEENLNAGESYIKSYARAFEKCGGDGELIKLPNNILGLEYAKSVLRSGADIQLAPVKRVGADFNDGELKDNYSSSSAIRANLNGALVKNNVPAYVYEDLRNVKNQTERFNCLCRDWLFLCDKENLKRVYGCTEGLENLLKKLCAENSYAEILEKACSKRYTQTRIRRILTANLLNLYADETAEFLQAELQPKILAVKKERADEILPLLDIKIERSSATEKCEFLTTAAYRLWCYLKGSTDNPNEKMILV